MRTTSAIPMPDDFPKRIHRALRHWHEQQTTGVLDDLLLADEIRSDLSVAAARAVSNEILIDGLDHLRALDPQACDLLQWRFLDKESARAVAYRLNVSEDVVFQRQRAAIAQLAHAVWDQESALRQRQAQRIAMRLPPTTYTRLFGVSERLSQARAALETASEPWILSLEGMGGIGKTAMADALARELAAGTRFRNIAWIGLRSRFFQLPDIVKTLSSPPDLSPSGLVNTLVTQLELTGLTHLPAEEMFARVKQHLKAVPCLVVVDNLETVTDYQALVPYLREFVAPGKVLITSRYSLRGETGVYILPLEALSPEDTLALVRHEAATQGLMELAQAADGDLRPIYDVTGGNPLATKLVVGQTHTFPLAAVLDRLREGADQGGEDLLTFVHADAWRTLDVNSRRLLAGMVLTGNGGGRLAQIAAAAGVDANLAATCLHRLVSLSLVSVRGSLHEKRYALHPLTQAFVARQALHDI